MFSVSKLMVLAAILAAVWYGFRLIGRLDEARKRKMAERPSEPDAADRGPPSKREEIVDLVRDERTGEFIARDDRNDRV
jgi:hypothetical protein